MNEKQGGTERGTGRHSAPNVPARTTKDNFRLDLREDQMATGSFRTEEDTQARRTSSMAQPYGRQYYSEEEKRREAKAHKKRNKIKAGKNKRIFKWVWLAMVIMVSLVLAAYLMRGANDFLAANRTEQTIIQLSIPENVTTDQLSDILEKAGAIKEKEFFKLYFKLTAEDDISYIRAGDHALDADMDYQEIIDSLMSGAAAEVVTVTVVEGTPALNLAAQLEEAGICKADDFLKELNSAQYQAAAYPEIQAINNAAARYYLLEGYLYPDTYFFYKESDPATVIRKMLETFPVRTEFLNARLAESGYTLDQIITMASIIQREAANVEDMYRVSAVLHNRLENGIDYGLTKLECDSTTFYPYKTQEDAPNGAAGTYNTYDIEGLPPGPICSPGIDAIKAALTPQAEYADYFYFCHAEDGTAYYAQTWEQHQENLFMAGLQDSSESDDNYDDYE